MTAIGEQSIPNRRIPYLDRLILAGGSDACAIRGPGQGIHRKVMTAIGEQGVPSRYVPYPYCAIISTGSDKIAVRRPRHGLYPTGMTAVNINLVGLCSPSFLHHLPYMYRHIVTARSDARAIG